MKINGVVYECVDSRSIPEPWNGIVALVQVAGGLEVWPYNGVGGTLLFDDELTDDEPDGLIEVDMPEGKVRFVMLTKKDYENQEGPSLFGTPPFQSDEQMHAWFYRQIMES